ncbi:hypothetical protein ADUPG1_008334 [Aduncisulcus paluster]|uniref:Uncharacterized protein n=1 Tax=Aduncisulcus paluster TaxID=2918883 RepID=A0ABQ5KUK1_9EUKA|nr:hypothetical protein ADUPG1_008334 [Aduncisulcus paluster]
MMSKDKDLERFSFFQDDKKKEEHKSKIKIFYYAGRRSFGGFNPEVETYHTNLQALIQGKTESDGISLKPKDSKEGEERKPMNRSFLQEVSRKEEKAIKKAAIEKQKSAKRRSFKTMEISKKMKKRKSYGQ